MNDPRLSQYQFNLFKGGIKTKKPTQTITLADVIVLIGGPAYEIATRELRALEPDLQKVFKADLDYVTFSGTFTPSRLAKNLHSHSGLICLDFDHVANLWETRLQLQADPHTLVLFTSPQWHGPEGVVLDTGPGHRSGTTQGFVCRSSAVHPTDLRAGGRCQWQRRKPGLFFGA